MKKIIIPKLSLMITCLEKRDVTLGEAAMAAAGFAETFHASGRSNQGHRGHDCGPKGMDDTSRSTLVGFGLGTGEIELGYDEHGRGRRMIRNGRFSVILNDLRQGMASPTINGSDLTRNGAFKH